MRVEAGLASERKGAQRIGPRGQVGVWMGLMEDVRTTNHIGLVLQLCGHFCMPRPPENDGLELVGMAIDRVIRAGAGCSKSPPDKLSGHHGFPLRLCFWQFEF
ncbi:unnamed protein product [Effrenium voratum]|nr:unnamed protein product [Effrenium voratum]